MSIRYNALIVEMANEIITNEKTFGEALCFCRKKWNHHLIDVWAYEGKDNKDFQKDVEIAVASYVHVQVDRKIWTSEIHHMYNRVVAAYPSKESISYALDRTQEQLFFQENMYVSPIDLLYSHLPLLHYIEEKCKMFLDKHMSRWGWRYGNSKQKLVKVMVKTNPQLQVIRSSADLWRAINR